MKKLLLSILISLTAATTAFAATSVFNSSQVGSSPVNTYVLQTNGTVSTWVATSSLGFSSSGATTSPAGSDTQVQWNNAGVFGASSNFTYSSTTPLLTILGTSTGGTVSPLSLTNNAAYASGNGARLNFNNIFAGNPVSVGAIEGRTISAGASSALIFSAGVVSFAEKMRLLSSGLLAIGTTTDNGAGLLYVDGTSTTRQLILPGILSKYLATDANGLVIATTSPQIITNPVTGTGTSTFLTYWTGTNTVSGMATGTAGYLLQASSTSASGLAYVSTTTLGLAAGTVTAVTVTTANGVSATVANQGTTPALTFTLGAITPTTVNGLKVWQSGGSTVTDTGVGVNALVNTVATNVTGFGYNVLTGTSGQDNTGVGYLVLSGTTGVANTAVGSQSMASAITAAKNTALGFNTLTSMLSGSGSVALGYNAGSYATSTSNELFINNQDRTNYLGDRNLSLIYGQFAAATTSQLVVINASTTITSLQSAGFVKTTATGALYTDTNTYVSNTYASNTFPSFTYASNTYQTALTNPVTGTGTNGFGAYWTSASAISTGKLIDDGTALGVNATSSTINLNVQATATKDGFNVASSTGTSQFIIKQSGKVGIASTTPSNTLSLGSGSITTTENVLATSTSMTIDWTAGNQQLIRTSTSGVTITMSNYVLGQTQKIIVCNPGTGTAGTITWTGITWPGGTLPTQTTTVNHCDVWSFIATGASSTPRIFGAMSANF